jgi:hypothetical protein
MDENVLARELFDRGGAALATQGPDELLVIGDRCQTGLGAEQLHQHPLVACKH